MLRPPVEPMLAQAREVIPHPGAVPGGMAVEPKFDGFRATTVHPGRPGGADAAAVAARGAASGTLPDLVATADQLPYGLVLDGELAVLEHEQLSFSASQRRASDPPRQGLGRRPARVLHRLPRRPHNPHSYPPPLARTVAEPRAPRQRDQSDQHCATVIEHAVSPTCHPDPCGTHPPRQLPPPTPIATECLGRARLVPAPDVRKRGSPHGAPRASD